MHPRIIISGAPASGKGTQCEYLRKHFGLVHLSTGDMLREAVANGTPVGLEAKNYMDNGKLVPDSVIIDVVLDRLNQSDCKENGWLLDGFPRTRAQADALQAAGIDCDVFIQLDCDESSLIERVVGRRMDPVTGKIYHLKYNPPPEDDPELLERLVHRSDDNEEKVKVRIDAYNKNLASIIDKYSKKMIRINNNRTPPDSWADIQRLMTEKLIGRVAPKFIISGAPASGKGTQCEYIKKYFNVVHLSTGDMLREAVANETPVGLEAKNYMDSGKLVPDTVIIDIVLERLHQDDCKEKGWLLDGFPRTRAQADALESAGINCDIFIQLDCDESSLIERVVGRRMDPVTGKIYHLKYNPPPFDQPEIIDRLVHRSDDTEEKVKVRIDAYNKNLRSIVDKFSDKMIRINNNRTPPESWADILKLVKEKFSSQFVLTAPKFIICGAPASGKGTQCEYIKNYFNVVHLSTGDMLREAVANGTPVGLEAKNYMDNGKLVPDSVMINIVLARLNQKDCLDKGWLLDGFPRTRAQADALEAAGIDCDVFIQLDCDESSLIERVVGRRMDPVTGKIYHLKYNPPEDDPELLDRLVHRSDDNEEKVKVRIDAYNKNLASIIDKYSKKMIRINNNRTPPESWDDILKLVKAKISFSKSKYVKIYKSAFKVPRFIISGAPASGKGTQCEFIKSYFNVVHLSTGDILRGAVETRTAVGLEAKAYMDNGKLVPDQIIIDVVLERLQQKDCLERGWLLDGFPRTRAQADALEKEGVECDVFIQLDVEEHLLVERVVGRRMDPVTGKIYHLKYSPPPAEDISVIHRLLHRSDDNEEKVMVRIDAYNKNLNSIVDKYSNKMIRINGNRSVDLIWSEIKTRSIRKVMYQVVMLVGASGSGKSAIASHLSKKYGYVHINIDELLWAEQKAGELDEHFHKLRNSRNAHFPSDVLARIVLKHMANVWFETSQVKFVIDGYMRDIDHVTSWLHDMSKSVLLDYVLHVDCDDEICASRLEKRSYDETRILQPIINQDIMHVCKSFDRLGKLRTIDGSLPLKIAINTADRLMYGLTLLPTYQRTVAMILPEPVANGAVPDITKLLAAKNINIIFKRIVTFERQSVEIFYPKSTFKNSALLSKHMQYLSSAPSLIMILEGTNVIQEWQELMGPSNPYEATQLAPQSLRAIYGIDELRNGVYGSSTEEDVRRVFDYMFDATSPGYYLSQGETNIFNNNSLGGMPLEDTYAMIKPISSQLNYDEIIAIVNAHGFEVISELKTRLSTSLANQFYSEHLGKDFFNDLVQYMSSGPVVCLHLRRFSAILGWRHLIGPTNYVKACSERYDSIRAKYGFDGRKNACHGSDSITSAIREIGFFFSVGTFHTNPINASSNNSQGENNNNSVSSSSSMATAPLPSKTKRIIPYYAKKVHQLPALSREEVQKMQTYAMSELNPVMSALVRNLVVTRPTTEVLEDVAISKLTDIKYQRMMSGKVKLDTMEEMQQQREQYSYNNNDIDNDSLDQSHAAMGYTLDDESIMSQ